MYRNCLYYRYTIAGIDSKIKKGMILREKEERKNFLT